MALSEFILENIQINQVFRWVSQKDAEKPERNTFKSLNNKKIHHKNSARATNSTNFPIQITDFHFHTWISRIFENSERF